MYLPPTAAPGSDADQAGGHSYGAVILPGDEATRDELREVLRGIRFSGWMAPPRGQRIVIVGTPGAGVVGDDRRGIVEVAGLLAARVAGPVLAVRVRRDRQLALVAWNVGGEVGRYSSDPSVEPGADDDVLAQPLGAENGEAFAGLWGRADAGEELVEVLEDELDPDSTSESERLGRILRMLDLPSWLVAAGELPRQMPTGPRTRELVRLRAGRTGFPGMLVDAVVKRARRRKNPPPIFEDPPRGGGSGFEPWMF